MPEVGPAAIYSRLVMGMRVVAVVSAIGNDTDDLIDCARRAGGDAHSGDPHTRARLLASGEERSALLLSLALERLGYRVTIVARGGFPFFESERMRDEPELLRDAPHHTPVRRLDEVRAARHPILRYTPEADTQPGPDETSGRASGGV